jgi:hypothetical protein
MVTHQHQIVIQFLRYYTSVLFINTKQSKTLFAAIPHHRTINKRIFSIYLRGCIPVSRSFLQPKLTRIKNNRHFRVNVYDVQLIIVILVVLSAVYINF